MLEGLERGFEIDDEVYLCPVNEGTVTPLLRSDYAFVDENFYSASLAVAGKMFSREGWSHLPGSNLIAWSHRARNSPIVYIGCGDGPSAYANPGLQRLIGNAIRWVATEAPQ